MARAKKRKAKKRVKKKVMKKKTTAKKKTKASSKKVSRKKTKPTAKKPVAGRQSAPIKGTLIGRVSHYFAHVNAAAFKIEKGTLQVGDQLYFKGHTTDFKQAVTSMQIDHAPVQTANVGDDIGIQVKDRVREHDAVYKL